MAEFCDVDPESAKLELRILTKGGARCEQYLESESIVCFCCFHHLQTDFVTSVTGRIAKKSYVTPHNRPTFEALRADKSKSHFIEIMSPFERPCYDFSIQVEKAAEAFAVPLFPRFHVDGAVGGLQPRGLLADARPLRGAAGARRPRGDVLPRGERSVQPDLPGVPDGERDRELPERRAGDAPLSGRRSGRALRARRGAGRAGGAVCDGGGERGERGVGDGGGAPRDDEAGEARAEAASEQRAVLRGDEGRGV